MRCPNCSSPLVAVGDGGTFVCRSCASQNNDNGNRALVAFNGSGNNLSNIPDPRSALAAAAEHIEFYISARDEAAKGENEELASRAKETIQNYRTKLEKVFAAYTKARSRLVDEMESTKELKEKYNVKANQARQLQERCAAQEAEIASLRGRLAQVGGGGVGGATAFFHQQQSRLPPSSSLVPRASAAADFGTYAFQGNGNKRSASAFVGGGNGGAAAPEGVGGSLRGGRLFSSPALNHHHHHHQQVMATMQQRHQNNNNYGFHPQQRAAAAVPASSASICSLPAGPAASFAPSEFGGGGGGRRQGVQRQGQHVQQRGGTGEGSRVI